MKSKLIITFSLTLLAVALGFIIYDFFKRDKVQQNPYEYSLDKLRKSDSSQLCYNEVLQWKPEMEKIRGIAIDKNDDVFVTGRNKVIKYNSKGEKLFEFQLDAEARNIAISQDGNLFLGVWDHVEIWNPNGELLKKWEKFGERSIVTSIAVLEEEIFVADFGNKIVYRCDFDGNIINEIGAKDTLKGIKGFFIPSPYFDVVIGRDGELWTVNPGYHRLEAYSYSGELKSSWERTSMQLDGFSGCCNPSHIALLSNGSFVTSEKGIERIKIHEPTGDFDCLVAGAEKFEEGTIGLDLAVNSLDNIYVLDPKKGLIRVFEKN